MIHDYGSKNKSKGKLKIEWEREFGNTCHGRQCNTFEVFSKPAVKAQEVAIVTYENCHIGTINNWITIIFVDFYYF